MGCYQREHEALTVWRYPLRRPITEQRVLWELALGGGPRGAYELMTDIGLRYGPNIVTAHTHHAITSLEQDGMVVRQMNVRPVFCLHDEISAQRREGYRQEALRAARAARARLIGEVRRHLTVASITQRELEAALLPEHGGLIRAVSPAQVAQRRFDATRAHLALEKLHFRMACADALPAASAVLE